MDDSQLIERIYKHLENDRAENAVMACLRLARRSKDYLNAAIFLRELYPDKEQFSRVFYEDTAKLNKDAQTFLWNQSLEIWIAGRTLDLNPEDDDPKKVFVLGAGTLDSEVEQLERAIQDLAIPPGMAPYDVAAFTDRYGHARSSLRVRIGTVQTIRQRIKARCLNYVISLERQLAAQEKPIQFLQKVQSEVNNYFKARSEDTFLKLQKAAELADSSDQEDFSLILTVVRRAIKAVADHFYPPVTEPVRCSDGKERKLGEDQYLNRLEEYLAVTFPPSTSTELLRAEANVLISYARKLNDISSKGVHADVSAEEAKQGILGLYLFLYNVVAKLQAKHAEDKEMGPSMPSTPL